MDTYTVFIRYAGSLIDIIEVQAISQTSAKNHAQRRQAKLCGPKYAKACKYEIEGALISPTLMHHS